MGDRGQAGKQQGIDADALNLAALVVSAVAAYFAPLQTFILAYAIVGPFHYLTEIAWLRKKDFFVGPGGVSPRNVLTIAAVLCGLVTYDFFFHRGWTAYAIALAIVLSLAPLIPDRRVLVAAVVAFFLSVHFVSGYRLFLAAIVPTVVHVYVFTLVFVVSGALRAKRGRLSSWLAPVLLVVIPIVLVKAGSAAAAPGSHWLRSEALLAGFPEYIAQFLGLQMEGTGEMTGHGTAIFRLLAFIYLHHYLNWFAKTGLLEWHKVSRRSWGLIVSVYAVAVGCYMYSFRVGFYVVYFLSMLHVLLEFPLDWRASIGLASGLAGVLRTRRNVTVRSELAAE